MYVGNFRSSFIVWYVFCDNYDKLFSQAQKAVSTEGKATALTAFPTNVLSFW